MTLTTISVGHYGHVELRGAKHWAILLYVPDKSRDAVAYQISGSTTTYALKQPELVNPMRSGNYLGKVDLGIVEYNPQAIFQIIQNVPITLGNIQWNCQDWTILALNALRDAGLNVSTPTKEQLALALQRAPRA